MAIAQPPLGSTTRIPWMDRLRVITIAGVVVVHAATAYLVDIGWYYEERIESQTAQDLLILPVIPAAIYGLAPLFMIAGWLSEKSLAHESPGAFARSRLLRLGVPLLVYFFLLDPLADFLGSSAAGEHRSLGSYLVDLGGDRDLGPVWFVNALLAFSLVLAVLVALRPSGPGPRGLEEPVRLRTLVAIGVAVAVADFAVWLRFVYLEPSLWNAQLAHWPQAAGVFALGVVAFRRGWLSHLSPRLARRCGWLTVAGLAGGVLLAGWVARDPENMLGGWHWEAAAFAILDAVTALSLCLWLAHWMGHRWNAPPRTWLRRASRGSYAAYLLHPVVLVGVSAAARPLPWPPPGKFVLVAAVGVPLCFAVGYLVTRLPGVRRVV